jgi:hypothetical protein
MSLILSGSSGLSDVDGSASTPSLRGTDADSGVFFPAADTVAIATGGTERVRTDSSGNVGIGTSSPASRLHVSSTSAETARVQSTSSGPYASFYNSSANRAGYMEWSTSALKIDAESGASSTLAFLTANNERARIDSSGNLLVGKTSADDSTTGFAYRASGYISAARNGGAPCYFNRTGTDGAVVEIANDGSTVGSISVSGSSTAYNTSSDYRLKEDIQPMSGALAKVAALKPVTYKWKVDGSDGEGFIAHELQAVVPDCVTGAKDAVDAEGNPVYQGIDTSFLVATLTAALQELKAELDAAKTRIAVLEGAAQ